MTGPVEVTFPSSDSPDGPSPTTSPPLNWRNSSTTRSSAFLGHGRLNQGPPPANIAVCRVRRTGPVRYLRRGLTTSRRADQRRDIDFVCDDLRTPRLGRHRRPASSRPLFCRRSLADSLDRSGGFHASTESPDPPDPAYAPAIRRVYRTDPSAATPSPKGTSNHGARRRIARKAPSRTAIMPVRPALARRAKNHLLSTSRPRPSPPPCGLRTIGSDAIAPGTREGPRHEGRAPVDRLAPHCKRKRARPSRGPFPKTA